MDVVFTEQDGYLEAEIQDTTSFPELKRQLSEILKACTNRKPPKLLLNFTSLQGHWSTVDRFEIGEIGGQLAPHVGRIAALAREPMIDPKKFGVQVARNRGLTVDVFYDREKALAWLLGPA